MIQSIQFPTASLKYHSCVNIYDRIINGIINGITHTYLKIINKRYRKYTFCSKVSPIMSCSLFFELRTTLIKITLSYKYVPYMSRTSPEKQLKYYIGSNYFIPKKEQLRACLLLKSIASLCQKLIDRD